MKPIISLFFIIIFLSFTQLSAQNCNATTRTGEGTFYGGVAGGIFGNCSLK